MPKAIYIKGGPGWIRTNDQAIMSCLVAFFTPASASADTATPPPDDLGRCSRSPPGLRHRAVHGARQLQHPVVAARRKLQLVHRRVQQGLPGLIQHAELTHLRRAHIGIAGDPYRRSRIFPLPGLPIIKTLWTTDRRTSGGSGEI